MAELMRIVRGAPLDWHITPEAVDVFEVLGVILSTEECVLGDCIFSLHRSCSGLAAAICDWSWTEEEFRN